MIEVSRWPSDAVGNRCLSLCFPQSTSSDEILDAFLGYLVDEGIEPYDHQEEAILELFAENNVILNTPTGSGKSLVAMALQFRAICQKRRSFYTVPVKGIGEREVPLAMQDVWS